MSLFDSKLGLIPFPDLLDARPAPLAPAGQLSPNSLRGSPYCFKLTDTFSKPEKR